MSDIHVYYEATPNPQTLKFYTAQTIARETANITNAAEAARSPLAQKIMGFPWAAGVFIGSNFVTVTKQEWVDWDIIAEPLSELIKEHLTRGEAVLIEGMGAPAPIEDDPNDSATVKTIKQILRDEIRPAVAMDGGDITFDRYENGRVFLQMQGSCSGCPSSALTLKEGIETRLKSAIPEIVEVVAV